jgi:hypothetical protein
MKKLLLSITLAMVLLPCKFITAQDYRPMAVDSAQWIVQKDDIQTPWIGDDFWEYYALGDTLVNETLYKKIYKRDLETDNHYPPYYAVSPYTLFALLRDDIAAKRVYAILLESQVECPAGEDVLFYDFSLSTGDTANQLCITSGIEDVIIGEVGVGVLFGISTRFFEAQGAYSPQGELYEGIGSSHGLFELMFTPFKSRYIFEVSLIFYCTKGDCPIVVSSNTIHAPVGLSVYPNPAKKLINVEMSENGRFENSIIELYNIEGQLVYKTFPVSFITQVPFQYLSSGIYLLRVWDGSKWTVSKVVKE